MLAETCLPSSWISSSLSFVRLTVSEIPDELYSCIPDVFTLIRTILHRTLLRILELVVCVVDVSAVVTDEVAAVKAVKLHVHLANHGQG